MNRSYDSVRIERKDFEAWVELVGGDTYGPDYRRAAMRTHGKFENGVEWVLETVAVEKVGNAFYYGRGDEWTHVRVNSYFGEAFHFRGQGSRSNETWAKAEEILDLLTGGIVEKEIKVTFA